MRRHTMKIIGTKRQATRQATRQAMRQKRRRTRKVIRGGVLEPPKIALLEEEYMAKFDAWYGNELANLNKNFDIMTENNKKLKGIINAQDQILQNSLKETKKFVEYLKRDHDTKQKQYQSAMKIAYELQMDLVKASAEVTKNSLMRQLKKVFIEYGKLQNTHEKKELVNEELKKLFKESDSDSGYTSSESSTESSPNNSNDSLNLPPVPPPRPDEKILTHSANRDTN